jgi:hypothetical protein
MAPWRQPLVHFLILGAGLFALVVWTGSRTEERASKRIIVDRELVLVYLQNQSNAFDPTHFSAVLDGLDQSRRDALIREVVREEALHRRALELGLDKDDYNIRRRLVEQLEFITQGNTNKEPPTGFVAAYFKANPGDYMQPPQMTFTHVFFRTQGRGAVSARRLAAEAVANLNRDKVPFADAVRHTERFLYHVNYVARTEDFIKSHFGVDFAAGMFALSAGATWQGPIDSAYGAHAVLIASRRPRAQPDLADVYDKVAEDARRQHAINTMQMAIDEIVDSYSVDVLIDEPIDKK